MTFRTVFDAAQQGYANWWFPALGLIAVSFAALLLFKPTLLLKTVPTGSGWRARVSTIIRWYSFLFAIL
jgi:hypothetical protein